MIQWSNPSLKLHLTVRDALKRMLELLCQPTFDYELAAQRAAGCEKQQAPQQTMQKNAAKPVGTGMAGDAAWCAVDDRVGIAGCAAKEERKTGGWRFNQEDDE